jgi:hypothetical protein
MKGLLLQLLLLWLVGVPLLVLIVALTYPGYVRTRVPRARRRVERYGTSSR